MRFRLIKREVGAPRRLPAPPPPEPKRAPPRAADLDNPYGRVFGTPRSREDLRKQDRSVK